MSRTRITLAATLLAATAVGAPAALAGPACSKPGAAQIHAVHEASEDVPLVGEPVGDRAHQAEERYCEL